MLKGTPIQRDEYRDYGPLDDCKVRAFNINQDLFLEVGLLGGEEAIELNPDDARELVAVLLQFLADAEVS